MGTASYCMFCQSYVFCQCCDKRISSSLMAVGSFALFADTCQCAFSLNITVLYIHGGYLEVFLMTVQLFLRFLEKGTCGTSKPPFLSCYGIVPQPPAEPGSLHFCAHTFSRVCVVSFVQSPCCSVPACASCLSEGGEKENEQWRVFSVSHQVSEYVCFFFLFFSFANELLPFRYITPPKTGEWINLGRRKGMLVRHTSKMAVHS